MSKTVLVTGATGFIGSVLVAYLRSNGYDVRIFLRPESDSRKASLLHAQIFRGRYNDRASLRNALDGTDMVIHLAGVTKSVDKEGFQRGNVMPVERLLEEIVKVNSGIERFVLVSSQAAAGPARAADPGVTELDAPGPVSQYGRSKLAGEMACLRWKDRVPVTIVRPPAVYGPGDRDVLQFFQLMKMRLMLAVGDGRKQRFSLIHVDDLVEGIMAAALSTAAAGETFFLASPRSYSWDEFAIAVQQELGVQRYMKIALPKILIRSIGMGMGVIGRLTGHALLLNPDKAAEMVQDYWVCSPAKAEKMLGFTAGTSLEQGLRSTLAWYTMKGWL